MVVVMVAVMVVVMVVVVMDLHSHSLHTLGFSYFDYS